MMQTGALKSNVEIIDVTHTSTTNNELQDKNLGGVAVSV